MTGSESVMTQEFTEPATIRAVSLRVIIGVSAMAGVPILGILSTLTSFKMVDQVNAMLPKEQRFSHFG